MSLPVIHLEDYLLPDQETVQQLFAQEEEMFERSHDDVREREDDEWMFRVPDRFVV